MAKLSVPMVTVSISLAAAMSVSWAGIRKLPLVKYTPSLAFDTLIHAKMLNRNRMALFMLFVPLVFGYKDTHLFLKMGVKRNAPDTFYCIRRLHFKGGWWGSNPRHSEPQSDALTN